MRAPSLASSRTPRKATVAARTPSSPGDGRRLSRTQHRIGVADILFYLVAYFMQSAALRVALRHRLTGGGAEPAALIDRPGNLDANGAVAGIIAAAKLFTRVQARCQIDGRAHRRPRYFDIQIGSGHIVPGLEHVRVPPDRHPLGGFDIARQTRQSAWAA